MILLELSALGHKHRTGIPNYVLQLASDLAQREDTSGFFANGKVLDVARTREFLRQRTAVLDAPAPIVADNTPVLLRKMRSAKIHARYWAAVGAHLVLRPLRNRANHAYLAAVKPRLQHFPAHLAEPQFDLPVVSTIHDLSTCSHPELHVRANILGFERFLRQLQSWHRTRHPLRLIAVSEYTKTEIGRILGPEFRDLTRVTPLGFDRAIFFPRADVPREDFILAVGTLEPRKNLKLLLEAFALGKDQLKGLRLVIVGGRGWRNEEFERTLREHPLRDRIELLGFVGETTLADLYRRCAIFCFPSLFEGFGIPPLEAMACGTPVVISKVASLPEVGGDAAVYCDPRDARSLVEALVQARDEKQARTQLSLARAEIFSWKRMVDQTLAVYSELKGR